MQNTLLRRPEDFLWATGIEDTFVPQSRPGHRALDEYQLMGHYEHWRQDLALVRDLGLKLVRWGVPWYRVEPFQPGAYDWSWTDQVIPYMVEELGIAPIVDLMHYGCPFWLRREFASPEYPAAVASYATAFAQRYRDQVHWYTPLNEPIVTALYCGQRGLWPPYLRSENGYVHILLQAIEGIIETSAALLSVNPDIRSGARRGDWSQPDRRGGPACGGPGRTVPYVPGLRSPHRAGHPNPRAVPLAGSQRRLARPAGGYRSPTGAVQPHGAQLLPSVVHHPALHRPQG